jgi:hypothetical protein
LETPARASIDTGTTACRDFASAGNPVKSAGTFALRPGHNDAATDPSQEMTATAQPEASSSVTIHRPLVGILFMCLAVSFFPVMNGLAKLMSQGYTSEQVVWARTVSHLLFVLALFVPKKPRVGR